MTAFDYQVIRRPRRRTASISVKPDCTVRILVPASLSNAQITELVQQKRRWIQNKLAHFEAISENEKKREYVWGESFTYLGRNYRLKVESGSVKAVKLVNGRLSVQVPVSVHQRDRYVQAALVEWYRDHALEKLQEKVERYAKVVGVSPSSVNIKTFSGRWGSCSSKGHIQFNWKVIIAPNRIVDYVVVHELCHLHEHNHSPEYWRCVERVLPDYRECREWLKENGDTLEV